MDMGVPELGKFKSTANGHVVLHSGGVDIGFSENLKSYSCFNAGSGSHIICVNIVCEEIQHIGGQSK